MTALNHALITREGLAVLDAALAWIDQHPEQHYQGSWIKRTPRCGTTYCLAGAIVMLDGAEPVWHGDVDESIGGYADFVRLADGATVGVGERAAELLGLDGDGIYEDLFLNSTTRADLGSIRDELAASLDGGS